MKKIFLSVLFLGFWILLLNSNLFADEVSAVTSGDTGSLSQKLDKIIDTQAEILKELNEMKAELEIVKIRASRG